MGRTLWSRHSKKAVISRELRSCPCCRASDFLITCLVSISDFGCVFFHLLELWSFLLCQACMVRCLLLQEAPTPPHPTGCSDGHGQAGGQPRALPPQLDCSSSGLCSRNSVAGRTAVPIARMNHVDKRKLRKAVRGTSLRSCRSDLGGNVGSVLARIPTTFSGTVTFSLLLTGLDSLRMGTDVTLPLISPA